MSKSDPNEDPIGKSNPEPAPNGGRFPSMPPDHELKQLFSELFLQLHNQARHSFRSEGSGHTLQPTALVSEAYLRLQKSGGRRWQDRDHFMLLAARAMRCVLVDHCRAKHALKRGGKRVELDLDFIAAPFNDLALDLHSLDLALDKLEESEPQMAHAVQLRFFVGTPMEEVARLIDMPIRTLERRMAVVRSWLHAEVSK